MARPVFETKTGAKIVYGHDETDAQAFLTDSEGKLIVKALSSLVPSEYDYIGITRTGGNITSVVYKTGGAGGTTISTLTLTYTGSNLDSVTKT